MMDKCIGSPPDWSPAHQGDVKEVSRLIAAAIINRGFRELLLRDAGLAIRRGFNGEAFELDHDFRRLVISIRAQSLSEFARQIAEYRRDPVEIPMTRVQPDRNGNGHARSKVRSL